jgi:hypothetical protein
MKIGRKPLFDPQSDPFARYRILGGALAFLLAYVAIGQLWRNGENPISRDFVAFWGAAKLAIAGKPALAYDPVVLHGVQSAVATFREGSELPFAYTPAFLLLVLPFGFLPYPYAMVVWVCATLVLYLLALRRLIPNAGILALAFPPVFVNCVVGQNGFLCAALFFAAIATLQRRPFVAGLLIGCLVFKPQLGVLFPLALIADRQWRAIAGAAISSISIILAGLVAFGWTTFTAWLGALPHFASIAKDGTVGWVHLTSVYAAARQAGLSAEPAFVLHAAVLGACAVPVWRVWRSKHDNLAKASVLACATALSSSYIFLYDQLILILPLFWLAKRKANPGILACLWCLPIVSMFLYPNGGGPLNLGPLLPIALLLLVMRELRPFEGWRGNGKVGQMGEPVLPSRGLV